MRLSIGKQTKVRLPVTRLERLFELVAGSEVRRARARGNVNLVFVSDATMRRLNRRFRGIDRTTDVLSFNLEDDPAGDDTFGEVYISVPQAIRQATQLGHGRFYEYLRLACHGFLHLFGYDHDIPAREKKMAAREESFLSRLEGGG